MIFYHILYMCATICCVWLNGIEVRLPNIAINIYKLFLSFKCAKRVYMYIIHGRTMNFVYFIALVFYL